MIEFDTIEAFNGLDETLNFGTRSLADGTNLHEANTLCILKSSIQQENPEVVGTFPQINSLIHDEKVIISIGKDLYIFGNIKCDSLVFRAKLDEEIDCFCVCKSRLLICLRNGIIHLLDLNIYEIVNTKILAENLWSEDRYFIGCFTELKLLESHSFLIVNSVGTIYRIFFDCNDSDLKVSIEILKEYKKKIKQAALTNNSLLMDGEVLLIHDLESCDYMQISGLQLKSVYPCSKNEFLGLTNEGGLIRICAMTLLVYPLQSSIKFDNLIFNKKKCGVTTCDDELKCHVKMLNFPDLSEIYSLKLRGDAQLVYSNNVEDEQIIICKVDNCELHIQMINETLPEKRLERLLRKQRFDEAESLANLFGLDMECIRKAKAQMLVDKTVCDTNDINNLIEILDTITDFGFKLKCCANVTCDGFDDVRKILSYGSKLDIKKHQVSNDEDNFYSTINDALYKFDTFTLLSRHSKSDFDAIAWCDFCEKNLLQCLYEQLKQQNIEVSIILYTRMDNNTISQITQNDIENILNILSQMPLNYYMPFLYTFIPKTLVHFPLALRLILRWIYQRVFDMERKFYADFPENAMSFIDKMWKLINFETKQECAGAWEQLHLTEKAVKTIQIFRNNFKVFVPLEDCLKGPVSLVRALLFLMIEIDQNLVDFLIKFLIENRFEPDAIFHSVIEEFVAYEERNWIDILLPIWEGISSTELKLKSILFILKSANLPWCPQIHNILKKALQFKHDLVEEIETQINREPVYIVLDNPAYNLKGEVFSEKDMDYYAIQKIIYCNKPTMEEDIFTLCSIEEKKVLASVLLIEHYIENSELTKAFRLIQSRSNKELSMILTELLIKLDSEFLSNINDYIQIASYIMTRGGIFTIKNGQNLFNDMPKNLKALRMIKENFAVKVKLIDIRKNKDDVINNCLTEIMINFEDGVIDVEQAMTLCSKLSNLLNVENDDLLVRLCQKTNNLQFELSANAASYIYDNSTNADTMYLMIKLMLKSMAAGKVEISKSLNSSESLEDLEENNEIDLGQLQKYLQYSQKLSTKIAINSEGEYEQDIFNWINSTIYNLSECETTDIFLENLSIDLTCFKAFCDIFLIYINYIETVKYKDLKFLKNSDEKSTLEFSEDEFRTRIQFIVQNLFTNGKFQTALNTTSCIQSVLLNAKEINPETQHMLTKIINTCNTQLVRRICEAPHIDVDRAFNLLCSYNYDRATKIIKQMLGGCKRNMKNFKTVALLGIKVSHYFAVRTNVRFYEEIILQVNWWSSIKNCTLPLKDFLICTDIKEFLSKLIQSQSYFGLKEIQKFCADFHLELEHNYMQYLKKLMVNWAPIYKIEKNIRGHRCLIMENDENQLFDDCIEVINLIQNKEQVFKFVTTLSESVNIYHYEVFICILKIVTALNMENKENVKKMRLLKFLKNYKRVSQPNQTETEEWFTKFPDTQCIEPLSEFRLSFTSTLFSAELWNILRFEMNLKSYTKWFNMIPILTHLKKDDICSYSIKEVVRIELMENKVQSEWLLRPKHQDLCDEVNKCAQHISDPERALSAVYHLTTNLPQGADQVYAAKLSNEYAIKYKNSGELTEDKKKAVIKVEKRYLNYSSMHILHQNNLADQKYLQLVGNPDSLIDALYSDERIIKQNIDCPDINKTVDEIADLHDIKIQEKRISFLENWLSDKNVTNLDESLCFLPTISLNNYDDESSNLKSQSLFAPNKTYFVTKLTPCTKKASYMCLSGDVTFWRNYLLSKGLVENENVKFPKYHYQGKALKCYCEITPESEVIKESQSSSYQEFLYFIDRLFLLHDLQCLGIHVNLETLNQCKKELLRKLSKNTSNPLNLKIMASICTNFMIYDIKYWELIISNMIKLKLFDSLMFHVNFLRKEAVLYKQFYIDAWQCIINNSFNFPMNYTKEEFNKICIDNMHTIKSCPLLFQLDLEPVYIKCVKIGRKDIAAWLLQYLPENKRNTLVTNLLENVDKNVLINSLKELFNHGLGISIVIDIINEA